MNSKSIDTLQISELESIIKKFQREGGILDLSRYSMSDISLKKYMLSEVRADNSVFINCSFEYAEMAGSVFSQTSAKSTNFSGAVLVKSEFYECDLQMASFCNAILTRGFLNKSNLTSVNFSGATLKFTSFIDCDLTDTLFENADIEGCEFKDCTFNGVPWSGVKPPDSSCKST